MYVRIVSVGQTTMEFVTSALVTLIVAFFILLWLADVTRPPGFPPGPVWFPLVGCYLQFRCALSRQGQCHLVWTEWARQYGSVVGLRLFSRDRVVLLSGCEAIKDVLARDDCEGRPNSCISRVGAFGEQLVDFLTVGRKWQQKRCITTRHLGELGLGRDKIEKLCRSETATLIGLLRKHYNAHEGGEAGLHDLHDVCDVSVINCLWALVTSARFERSDSRLARLCTSIGSLRKSTKTRAGFVELIPILRSITPASTSFIPTMKAVDEIKDLLKETVCEHKTSITSFGVPKDLIDAFLQEVIVKDESRTLSEMQLLSLCLDVFITGAETTNSTLGFSLLYLLHHPEVQRRAQRDIDAVVGRARPPSLADRPLLPYVDAIIMEVQRMTTILPVTIPYKTTKDCEILGFPIPKDTTLLPNLHSVLMDPKHWRDPEIFRPERFLDESYEHVVTDDWFIPFGISMRQCLGEILAKNLIFLFLTSLLQNFTFEVVPGKEPPSLLPQDGITLSPQPFGGIIKPR